MPDRAVSFICLFTAMLLSFQSGCDSLPGVSEHSELKINDEFSIKFEGDPMQQKSIFVFLDGTANDHRDTTNVWRLFQEVKLHKNLQTIGRYIPGVGSIEDPLDDDPKLAVIGDALGKGMEPRIEAAYEFIAEHYRAGDKVFIFGFSRGAHQARAIAGILAYAGVPAPLDGDKRQRHKILNGIIDFLKDIKDEDFLKQWAEWKPNQAPLLSQHIQGEGVTQANMQPVEVTLLGVWDTVPGSSFKNYAACKEEIGIAKRNISAVPGISKGQRYKSDSYPPIRHIVHAVAFDENRTKFMPLYLCQAIAPHYTRLEEIWFPGAHADVGGGYDNTELPNLSLSWMIERLENSYTLASQPNQFVGNPKGLAHWSYGDGVGSLGSKCHGRKYDDRQPPLGYQFHPSVEERKSGGLAPIWMEGKRQEMIYPVSCRGEKG